MERRVPGGQREIAGAVLTISTTGGYSVTHRGDYIGYLHASAGDKFNVYRRRTKEEDEWLGIMHTEDGVRAILRAAGRVADPPSDEPLRRSAVQIADCLSTSGYAFIEDDKIEALTMVLRTFLADAEIPASDRELPRQQPS